MKSIYGFVALIMAVLLWGCGCGCIGDKVEKVGTGSNGGTETDPEPKKILQWCGTYERMSGNTLFEISETTFRFAVPLEGKLRDNVQINPHVVKRISDTELIISGTNSKSARQETVTYRLVKTDEGVSLEKQGGAYSGPLGVFRKRAPVE